MTVTFWLRFAGATPVATIVILAVYGVAWGLSALGSTVTVRSVCAPGSTTPVVGFSVIQFAPVADAVYGIGPPVVDNVIVCGLGAGGALKFSVVELSCRAGSGWLTTSVTGTETVAAGFVVTTIVALYVPTLKLVGFTVTDRFAGVFPVSGVAVSQSVFEPVIDTE